MLFDPTRARCLCERDEHTIFSGVSEVVHSLLLVIVIAALFGFSRIYGATANFAPLHASSVGQPCVCVCLTLVPVYDHRFNVISFVLALRLITAQTQTRTR